ncbi:TetR/AcrR family transcriptional regulator C-terminal domain-containing protein [Amycolatopsis sp. NPDC004625]|uniref:TetR/AcrR family transcriptional regulator C-terminal domain-containing protein n=1 Tax=Amycolatopsis sp. NPDC004625 TaxID=3154670 RepID=UPI0033BC22F9
MALTRQDTARSGLELLNDVGLNGLTLLDEMATQMYRDSAADRQPPASMGEWEGVAHSARALRRMMLAYRDGGKVFAGTYLDDTDLVGPHPLRRSIEAGLDEGRASRATFIVCFVRRGGARGRRSAVRGRAGDGPQWSPSVARDGVTPGQAVWAPRCPAPDDAV